MSDSEDRTTVTVTSKGQATILKQFRDKLHIDTPGRVQFVENERGEIVARPVKRPSELRGALVPGDERHGKSATAMLREEREQDKEETDRKYGLAEQNE